MPPKKTAAAKAAVEVETETKQQQPTMENEQISPKKTTKGAVGI